MTILDNIRAAGAALIGRGRQQSSIAYGNMWPPWEVSSPQYPQPNPYNLAQLGYRKDELVYSCIDYRAQTVSEPPALLYKGKGEDEDEPLGGLFDSFPRKQPNSEMGEAEFWMVSEIYRLIAGTVVWEIETNRLGEPINLWPLNPSYCSFKRGNGRPLDKVVYQYPGLEPANIDRDKCVIFQEFDPLHPMLQGLSRSAVAMKSIGVHGSTSDFLATFFQRGAIITGYLKFAQSLSEVEAERARKLWRDKHGGFGNWAENNVAVLGQGGEYVPLQMNMKDMAFADIDGRTESLICMVFGFSPILLGAKVGLAASTLANYEQAQQHYINRVLQPSWRWYANEITQQLVPYLELGDDVYAEFDTSVIGALKEDENALWQRVLNGATANLIYRDEARGMLGLAKVDGENKVFLGAQVGGVTAPAESARIVDPEWVEPEETETPVAQTTGTLPVVPSPFTTTTTAAPTFSEPTPTDETQFKTWRAAALALSQPGPVGTPFDNELANATSKSQVRAIFEAHWPTKRHLDPLVELARFNDLMETRAQPGAKES